MLNKIHLSSQEQDKRLFSHLKLSVSSQLSVPMAIEAADQPYPEVCTSPPVLEEAWLWMAAHHPSAAVIHCILTWVGGPFTLVWISAEFHITVLCYSCADPSADGRLEKGSLSGDQVLSPIDIDPGRSHITKWGNVTARCFLGSGRHTLWNVSLMDAMQISEVNGEYLLSINFHRSACQLAKFTSSGQPCLITFDNRQT